MYNRTILANVEFVLNMYHTYRRDLIPKSVRKDANQNLLRAEQTPGV